MNSQQVPSRSSISTAQLIAYINQFLHHGNASAPAQNPLSILSIPPATLPTSKQDQMAVPSNDETTTQQEKQQKFQEIQQAQSKNTSFSFKKPNLLPPSKVEAAIQEEQKWIFQEAQQNQSKNLIPPSQQSTLLQQKKRGRKPRSPLPLESSLLRNLLRARKQKKRPPPAHSPAIEDPPSSDESNVEEDIHDSELIPFEFPELSVRNFKIGKN